MKEWLSVFTASDTTGTFLSHVYRCHFFMSPKFSWPHIKLVPWFASFLFAVLTYLNMAVWHIFLFRCEMWRHWAKHGVHNVTIWPAVWKTAKERWVNITAGVGANGDTKGGSMLRFFKSHLLPHELSLPEHQQGDSVCEDNRLRNKHREKTCCLQPQLWRWTDLSVKRLVDVLAC